MLIQADKTVAGIMHGSKAIKVAHQKVELPAILCLNKRVIGILEDSSL